MIKRLKDLNVLSKIKVHHNRWNHQLAHNPNLSIHFFGFLPGLMYLNGLDQALHFPRKKCPRSENRAWISSYRRGLQTGIYPNESPGGWHVIGKKHQISYLAQKWEIPPCFLPSPGEQSVFYSISLEEFHHISMIKNHLKAMIRDIGFFRDFWNNINSLELVFRTKEDIAHLDQLGSPQ